MFIKEAWFWRGFQSAVFYYISCAPCTKVLDQRRKKHNAAKAKAEKAARKAARAQQIEAGDAVELEYDHPLPSSTNPFWEEEMSLGPGPPPKRRNRQAAGEGHGREKGRESKEKARKKSSSTEMVQTAALVTAKKSNGAGTGSDSSNRDTNMNTTTNSSGENPAERTHPDTLQVPQDVLDTDWNRRRYQREDELLWGLDGDDHLPLKATRSATSLSRHSSSGRGGQRSYHYARNPAVNDLHPPVVSTAPKSRLETQWMLQPPPRAKFMAGVERTNRQRSETASTWSSRASSKRTGANSSRAGETRTQRYGNTGNGSEQLLGVGSIARSRSRASSNQSLASSRPLSRTSSARQLSRSPSQKAPPPVISIDTVPIVMHPPSPSQPGTQVKPFVFPEHTSLDERENIKIDPPPLNSKATETTPSATEPSNILQPTSNQINRASSLNTDNRSTTTNAVGVAKGPQGHKNIESNDKDKDAQRWEFPGAEDGWVVPAIGVKSRRRGGDREGTEMEMDMNMSVGAGMGIGMGMDMGIDMGRRHRQRWSMDI